jgi:hypothetical protein
MDMVYRLSQGRKTLGNMQTLESKASEAGQGVAKVGGAASLVWLSFGSAAGYAQAGGFPVLSDDCDLKTPVDLAVRGADVNLPDPAEAVRAAFVCGPSRPINIRARLVSGGLETIVIRARTGNSVRVAETTINFGGRQTLDVDLPVQGMDMRTVTTLRKKWTWEFRCGDEPYRPLLPSPYGVRVFITAAKPVNRAPRESYYHLACSISGAASVAEAEANVWATFTQILDGKPVTNARGQRLCFWRDERPILAPSEYTDRDAQDLITLTDCSCYGWSDLLCEVLAIHGIVARVMLLLPDFDRPDAPRVPSFQVPDGRGGTQLLSAVGLLVRRWRWSDRQDASAHKRETPADIIDCGEFRWRLNVPGVPMFLSWLQPDVIDAGRAGHSFDGGEEHVMGMFANHGAVLVGDDTSGRWYDPSYAIGPFNKLDDYARSLLGVGEKECGGYCAAIGYRLIQRHNANTGRPEPGPGTGYLSGALPAGKDVFIKAVPAPRRKLR